VRTAAILLALLASAPARGVEVVRIAVALGPGPVTVSAPGLSAAPLHEGAVAQEVARGQAVVAISGDVLTLNGATLDAGGVVLGAAAPLRVDVVPDAAFAGELEVRRVPSGLAVIHALPLEDYVSDVTMAEMPVRFPPAALEAQAVAARTFAVFKKLEAVAEGRPWHLGATVLDQVYRPGRPTRAPARPPSPRRGRCSCSSTRPSRPTSTRPAAAGRSGVAMRSGATVPTSRRSPVIAVARRRGRAGR